MSDNILKQSTPLEQLQEKLEKVKVSNNGTAKIDKRTLRTTRVPNSGRKPNEEKIVTRGLKEWKNNFFSEKHTMQVTDPQTGQVRTIAKPRFVLLYERAFGKAMETGELSYIKELLDRNEGRPAQPVRGEGENDPPINLRVNNFDDILKKAYGN